MIRLALPHTSLVVGESIVLSVENTHYLKNVMRLKPKDLFLTLDGVTGLFETRVLYFDRRHCAVCLIERCIEVYQKPHYETALFFSPIKNLDWLLQKATELSVTHLYPCLFERSSIRHLSQERAEKIILEACEQSQRIDFPKLYPLKPWQQHFQETRTEKKPTLWIFQPHTDFFLDVLKPMQSLCSHILIGPEGGLSPREIESMKQIPEARVVSLGPHILRAETAALAALVLVQSHLYTHSGTTS